MNNVSRTVSSSQDGTHKNLPALLTKHSKHPYRQPYRDFNQRVFEQINHIKIDSELPIILDSGCGTGESTKIIAKQNPASLVIGIDKSLHRLSKSGLDKNQDFTFKENLILARTDIIDFWRLAIDANWKLEKHFILYPNPWPKAKHLSRRWHGHPVFPTLLKLGGFLELRTNWNIYAEEFSMALSLLTKLSITNTTFTPDDFLSPFEKKYSESKHELYRCTIDLGSTTP